MKVTHDISSKSFFRAVLPYWQKLDFKINGRVYRMVDKNLERHTRFVRMMKRLNEYEDSMWFGNEKIRVVIPLLSMIAMKDMFPHNLNRVVDAMVCIIKGRDVGLTKPKKLIRQIQRAFPKLSKLCFLTLKRRVYTIMLNAFDERNLKMYQREGIVKKVDFLVKMGRYNSPKIVVGAAFKMCGHKYSSIASYEAVYGYMKRLNLT